MVAAFIVWLKKRVVTHGEFVLFYMRKLPAKMQHKGRDDRKALFLVRTPSATTNYL